MIWTLAVSSAWSSDPEVDFEQQIAPILAEHCVRCHAPGNAKGDVSLATPEHLREGGYFVSGDAEASYLIELIASPDGESPRMPAEGDPLSEKQVELVRRWIDGGAVWPEGVVVRQASKADKTFWSLRPLRESTRGEVAREKPAEAAAIIDEFIAAKLAERGLSFNPLADRRTLIRRATYDLTGLPPTPEEVDAFVNDPDPEAYEKLIDRLLASPRYGERWGRHWLDVVRFGESIGFERNQIVNDLWPFRDYVIESFNEDKPFDRFIREHLAGDVFGAGDPDVVVGSAFLVAGPYDDVGNQDPVQAAQIRANTIDEIIRATSGAFLGLTVGCARCHDHKFDPIRQRDYYRMYATLAGVRHGSRVVATAEEKAAHAARVQPLHRERDSLAAERKELLQSALERGQRQAATHEQAWTREPVDRQRTEETFAPVAAKFVRLISEGQDANPANTHTFGIDEFEVWAAAEPVSERPNAPKNVALSSRGAKASGSSRRIEDFPGAYGPQKAIDGKTGERFLATGGRLVIELAEPTRIDRVVFSSARGESRPDHPKFAFVGEYRIEVSTDGDHWTEVADSHDRRPVNEAHRNHRLRELAMTADERETLGRLDRELAEINREIAAVPPLRTVWVGTRLAEDAKGPFHIFLGGSPQRKGEDVVPANPVLFADSGGDESADFGAGQGGFGYELAPDAPESARRVALADWIVHPENPLTPRVLANRVWHYHFGTGIVDTPSDFGYMGGQPTHPLLLDWLARQLHAYDWRLKPLHKSIMMSRTYRQSSGYRDKAGSVDADSRLLWRFPPRRLTAEEIRDTMLSVAGQLDLRMGGPGFRLYRYLQDNVSTYVPLDEHGPETYRRAVYHQNARASVVDLMTDFDQPDCAFSTPERAETTTPLQALTLLNHSFTLDMAEAMAGRLRREAGQDPDAQIRRAYRLAYARVPVESERSACRDLVRDHGLAAFCRVLLNTSELIHVR